MPGADWSELSPPDAHAWLRDVALRLPGVQKVEAVAPGDGRVSRWKQPERSSPAAGRRAAIGSDKRLDGALYAARSRVVDLCLQADILPPDIVVGEAINDVTARQMFEAEWVALASGSTKLGDDEYEWN